MLWRWWYLEFQIGAFHINVIAGGKTMQPAGDFTSLIVSDEKPEILSGFLVRVRWKWSVCSDNLDLGLLEEDVPDTGLPCLLENFEVLAVVAWAEVEDAHSGGYRLLLDEGVGGEHVGEHSFPFTILLITIHIATQPVNGNEIVDYCPTNNGRGAQKEIFGSFISRGASISRPSPFF